MNAVELATDIPGLVLIQMLTRADDELYFDFQNRNREHIAEHGNTIDSSVEEVTKRRLEHSDGRFGIWLEGKLIGMVGYSTKNHPKEAEIGILLDAQFTGHGYATAAAKALTDFALPRFVRVYAEVAPDNDKSINLLKRLGYKTDGKVVQKDWGQALVFETSLE
jgi:RimJ/RimL family protein N-acetyltransferase